LFHNKFVFPSLILVKRFKVLVLGLQITILCHILWKWISFTMFKLVLFGSSFLKEPLVLVLTLWKVLANSSCVGLSLVLQILPWDGKCWNSSLFTLNKVLFGVLGEGIFFFTRLLFNYLIFTYFKPSKFNYIYFCIKFWYLIFIEIFISSTWLKRRSMWWPPFFKGLSSVVKEIQPSIPLDKKIMILIKQVAYKFDVMHH
jgi:hypothetical protein